MPTHHPKAKNLLTFFGSSQPSSKPASPPIGKKEVVVLTKAKKKSLAESRKKTKIDKTLERKDARQEEVDIISFV